MRPIFHFLTSLVISSILILMHWRWWQIFLFFVGAFFIDVDHYFYFVCKAKSWNLKKAYKWFITFERKLPKTGEKYEFLLIFHTIEVFIFLLAFSFILFDVFFPVFLGFIIHNIIDIIHGIEIRKKIRYKRAYSLIVYIVKNRKKCLKK